MRFGVVNVSLSLLSAWSIMPFMPTKFRVRVAFGIVIVKSYSGTLSLRLPASVAVANRMTLNNGFISKLDSPISS
jgi:hypothetical protein